MGSSRFRFVFVVAVTLIIVFATSVWVESQQCNVTYSKVFTNATTKTVYKGLSQKFVCTLTYQKAYDCFPGYTPVSTFWLKAYAFTGQTASPSCRWNCACGPVTINGSDGLPVELMDFSIDD